MSTHSEDRAACKRAKRNAWLLALTAAGVYAAVIVWHAAGAAG